MTNAANDGANWFYGECLTQWSWGTMGTKRMFVIGNFFNPSKPPLFAYIGDLTGTSLESKLNFLKGVQFLREFRGKKVNREHILEVLESCSERVTKVLLKAIPDKMRLVTSCEPKGVRNYKLYCEDHRLSLNTAGKQYWAIDTQKISEPIRFFEHSDVEDLLDFVASVLDLEATYPTEPAMKKAKNELMWDYKNKNWNSVNPRFAEGRALLESVVSRL